MGGTAPPRIGGFLSHVSDIMKVVSYMRRPLFTVTNFIVAIGIGSIIIGILALQEGGHNSGMGAIYYMVQGALSLLLAWFIRYRSTGRML